MSELIVDDRLTPNMERVRNGSTMLFRTRNPSDRSFLSLENAEVVLKHERPEMYAELIDGNWFWVNGCEKCNGDFDKHSYVTCYEHNRCISRKAHRSEITEAPWGVRGGWRCKPCQSTLDKEARETALAAAKSAGHSELDCMYEAEIICPYCATKQSSDDRHESESESECTTCGGTYSLEVDYSITYSTKRISPPEGFDGEEE